MNQVRIQRGVDQSQVQVDDNRPLNPVVSDFAAEDDFGDVEADRPGEQKQAEVVQKLREIQRRHGGRDQSQAEADQNHGVRQPPARQNEDRDKCKRKLKNVHEDVRQRSRAGEGNDDEDK